MRLFFMFVLLLFFLWGCTQREIEAPKPPLIVGMSTDYLPVAFKNNETTTAIEVDFATLLAKALGRDLEIKVFPWEEQYNALRNGEIDIIMSGIYITKKYPNHILFSEPYTQISQMALMRESMSTPSDLKKSGKSSIGYVFSTQGEAIVKKRFNHEQLVGFNSHRVAIASLQKGDIDYFFYDAPTIWNYHAEHNITDLVGLYTPYNTKDLAWAIKADNTMLLDNVNLIIKRWKDDGTIAQVLNKWVRIKVITSDGWDL
jgi:ABC-type amino acid transport substrate-binding protein